MMFPTFMQRFNTLKTKLDRIAGQVITSSAPLAPFSLRLGNSPEWHPLPHHSYWGINQTDFHMRGSYTVPASFPADAEAALWLPLGDSGDFEHPEALLSIDGVPIAAVDRRHQRIRLGPAHRQPGATYAIDLHGWTGLGGALDGDERPRCFIGAPALVTVDRAVEAFVALARAAFDAIAIMDEQRPEKHDLLAALEASLARLDTTAPAEVQRRAAAAEGPALQASLAAIGGPHPLTLHGLGHAHIDTAWLWTLDVARAKVDRTFHTALHLMDEFPEYIFTSSAPQHYAWFKARHPESFERLAARVREGRWEPLGGMWVEPDLNVTGAESLVRQFILGRRWFAEQFGPDAETPVLWLPDTFGYPASIPQIAAQAGMRYFFTIKLRWSEVNEFPHDTFWWQGIDGTRLLAHMSTVPYMGRITDLATYNADPSPSSALNAWAKQKDKRQHDGLMAYGWGDGGGGPTREMLDMMRALAEFPGVPRHKPSRARDFYAHLEATHGDSLPTWDGELYLETHQGTLTSQHRIKRLNLSLERRLHDLEFLGAYATIHLPGFSYPAELIASAWQAACLHQFHDILPGSSIDAVYDDAERLLRPIIGALDEATAAVLGALAEHFGGQIAANTVGAYQSQAVAGPDGQQEIAFVSAYALDRLQPLRKPPFALVSGNAHHVDNQALRVTFDGLGALTHYAGQGREFIIAGCPMRFAAYEDRPAYFDAWNIDPALLTTPVAFLEGDEPPEIVTQTDYAFAIRFRRRLRNSPVTITVSFDHDTAEAVYDLDIDWQEKNLLFKVEIPLAIHARQAAYGIQWGQVVRPTHRNTTWEAAQWEVAHHGWLEVAEPRASAFVITDGVYGASVTQGRAPDGQIINTVSLTLVKRASTPAPQGDAGPRKLRFALRTFAYPIDQRLADEWLRIRWQQHHAIERAATLANPLRFVTSANPPLDLPPSLVQDENNACFIQTIKRAEDGAGLIMRLYETRGTGGAEAKLTFGFNVAQVQRADLLENPVADPEHMYGGRHVVLALRPFEIVTLRVTPA